ncbi:MAG: hypothetical protein GW854_06865 [Erythrobacter sp.]|nr:hypothetical protein [Erythrobacter sp.]
MIRNVITLAGATLLLAACNSNSAPGNDKLAELEKAPTAAPQMAAGPALANAAPGGLYPGILNEADVSSLGGTSGRCVFRMTKVGFPSFIYGGDQANATIKLNGKLVMLPATEANTFSGDGLTVEMAENVGSDAEATMIVRIPGAPNELGFRGVSSCSS